MTPKCSFERRPYAPGQSGREGQSRRGRASDYLLQLREKQKARRIYGVMEKQFSRYFRQATQRSGLTGSNLLIMLESRLDNVIYRLGIADSRAQARQLVNHGHIMINGRKTSIPSAMVKPGDALTIRPESSGKPYFKERRQTVDDRRIPRWLSLDTNTLSGSILNLPTREDIELELVDDLVHEHVLEVGVRAREGQQNAVSEGLRYAPGALADRRDVVLLELAV